MSENRASFTSVIIWAVIIAALSIYLWMGGETTIVEKVLIVAAVVFCIFLLIKQKWALAGICITLLLSITVYFWQAWMLPIVEEDTALIWPNVFKMIVGVILFIGIGRQSIDDAIS